MTDTFGAAVGAAHIAHRAIEYAVEYHHAPKEMKAIAKQMLVSTIALEQVQNLFEKLFPDQQEVRICSLQFSSSAKAQPHPASCSHSSDVFFDDDLPNAEHCHIVSKIALQRDKR